MWPARGAKTDTKSGHRGHKATDASVKTLFQNRITKGEKLMFVRRDNIGDEKKAIFIRITNIAISCSANNETVRVIKKQMSAHSSRASTPTTPSTPKRPRMSAKKKQQTKSYIAMLQRHRKSSFASMLDEYSHMDDSASKESQKRSLSLEDEVRQIDTFFNNLASKKGGSVGRNKVHVMDEDFDIARLWKDLGYTVVKSKNRPSIFEIASPSAPNLSDKGLRDMRKSFMYLKRGEGSSLAVSDTISRGPSVTSRPSMTSRPTSATSRQPSATSRPTSSASISHRTTESPTRTASTEKPSKSAIILSPKHEAKPDDKASGSKTEVGQTSRIRRYFERLKSFFSWGKDPQPSRDISPQPLNKDKITRVSSSDSFEPSRHVKWSDSKTSPISLSQHVEEDTFL